MPPARRSARAGAANNTPYSRADHPSRSNSNNASNSSRVAATIARSDSRGLRLTVKAAPSDLRQAISGRPAAASGSSRSRVVLDDPSDEEESDDDDEIRMPAVRSARSTRNAKAIVEVDTDEDMMDAPGEEEEEEEEDEDGELDSEADAEGEEDDEEADEIPRAPPPSSRPPPARAPHARQQQPPTQQKYPPAPTIRQTTVKQPGSGVAKTQISVSGPVTPGPMKSVERKEVEDDEDDEDEDDELSELASDEEDDENLDEDEEEDAEGDEEDDDEEGHSRSATPDLSKLTKRQRAAFYEDSAAAAVGDSESAYGGGGIGGLLALSNEAQKKKHLTAEEHAVRRAEMARRRKNLSEKRNEEEKMDTINKLLSKPATKRRSRAEILAAARAAETEGILTPALDEAGEQIEVRRADPLYTRWTSARNGCRVAVPVEWLDGPMGQVFGGPVQAVEVVADAPSASGEAMDVDTPAATEPPKSVTAAAVEPAKRKGPIITLGEEIL